MIRSFYGAGGWNDRGCGGGIDGFASGVWSLRKLGFEFRILNFGFWILDFGFCRGWEGGKCEGEGRIS